MADFNQVRQKISSDRRQRFVMLMVLGAAGFWLPDTVWHAVKGMDFNGADVRAVTLIMPVTLLGTYVVTRTLQRVEPRQSIGWPFIAGVWLLGGVFITIGVSFSGGGFAGGVRGGVIMILLSIIPIYLFIMATYDGSLAALVVVSAIAAVVWFIGETRKNRSNQRNSSRSG